MLRGFKFRIYPNKEQKEYFEKVFNCTRFIYNFYLYEKTSFYLKSKDSKEKPKFKYTSEKVLKDQYTFLKESDSTALQQERINLENAFTRFFQDCRNNNRTKFSEKKISKLLRKEYKDEVSKYVFLTPDYPKFKKKSDNHKSFRTVMNFKVNQKEKTIKIPKCSPVKYRDKRTIEGNIKNITISVNPSGQYFATILAEDKYTFPTQIENVRESKVFSADMSAKNFMVSEDVKFENQKFYRSTQRRLKLQQRRLSRKEKGSKNKDKQKMIVAKHHQKVVDKRTGYQKNLAYDLSTKFDAVVLEDLNIKGMQQFSKGLSKTVTQDFSWYDFTTWVDYFCKKQGSHFVKVDRFFPSSKLCYECGQVKSKEELTLSNRVYKCDCGYEEDRDINACRNIKREGITILKNKGINLLKKSTFVAEGKLRLSEMNDVSCSGQETQSFRGE